MSPREKLGQMMQPDWRGFRWMPKLQSLWTALPSAFALLAKRTLHGPLSDEACARGLGIDGLGSVLGGGGASPMPNVPSAWQKQMGALQLAAAKAGSGVPLLICNDSVHGQGNVRDATLFPHHIGQGCMDDPALVEELARVAARESYACGINWLLSPCAAVAQDLRWGRTYECFSEEPELVGRLAAAEVRGIQRCGFPMASCLKHWVADGGTILGTGCFDLGGVALGRATHLHGLDQGDARMDDAELRRMHIAPYLPSLAEGALTVMVSYSSVNGQKCHASQMLLTKLLKEELGFEGVVVSDYNAVQQCGGSFADAMAALLNAGVDVVMTAGGMFGDLHFRKQLEVMESAVAQGKVSMARVDDAVRRVLRVKVKMGLIQLISHTDGEAQQGEQGEATAAEALVVAGAASGGRAAGGAAAAIGAAGTGGRARRFFRTNVSPMGDAGCVGSAEHRAIARRAVAKSCVLLKNEAGLLPLTPAATQAPAATLPRAPAMPSAAAPPASEHVGTASSDGGPAELLVTGYAAHDLGYQCGGWTIEWQGCRGNAFTKGTTLWQGILAARPDATLLPSKAAAIRKPDASRASGGSVALVITGEPPYAEGYGDAAGLELPHTDARVAGALADAGWSVVLVLVTGRPLVIPPPLLDSLTSVVIAWLPGTEGEGVADVLFGRVGFGGKLAFSWPRNDEQAVASVRAKDPLFSLGYGLTTQPAAASATLRGDFSVASATDAP
jgi:beta-glucosidase